MRFALSRGRRDSAHQSPPSHDLTCYPRPMVPGLGGSSVVAPVEPELRRVPADLHPATERPSPSLNPCDFDETRCTTWNVYILESCMPALLCTLLERNVLWEYTNQKGNSNSSNSGSCKNDTRDTHGGRASLSVWTKFFKTKVPGYCHCCSFLGPVLGTIASHAPRFPSFAVCLAVVPAPPSSIPHSSWCVHGVFALTGSLPFPLSPLRLPSSAPALQYRGACPASRSDTELLELVKKMGGDEVKIQSALDDWWQSEKLLLIIDTGTW